MQFLTPSSFDPQSGALLFDRPDAGLPIKALRHRARQSRNYCELSPGRRATVETTAPSTKLSATIPAFSGSDKHRRPCCGLSSTWATENLACRIEAVAGVITAFANNDLETLGYLRGKLGNVPMLLNSLRVPLPAPSFPERVACRTIGARRRSW